MGVVMTEDELRAYAEETAAIRAELLKANPDMHPVQAHIVASDIRSRRRAEQMLAAGEITFEQSVNLIGSYARFDFVLESREKGFVTDEAFFEMLPELWRECDPDDTSDRARDLWIAAWKRNGSQPVIDGEPLPKRRVLTLYRGQGENDPLGVSWSLHAEIARKFARTLGGRVPVPGGIVLSARVPRSQALAYLTGRGEDEVIVDPRTLNLRG